MKKCIMILRKKFLFNDIICRKNVILKYVINSKKNTDLSYKNITVIQFYHI